MKAEGSAGVPWYKRQLHGPLKWIARALTILLVAYIVLAIARVPAVEQQKNTAATVAKIESQHLTMADADGSRLPPPPDPKQNDATIAGIDANGNGIRDDVELAIFATYPGAANLKLRAAELQYAMTEQMFLTDVFNTETWVAVAQAQSKAVACIYEKFAPAHASAEIKIIDLLAFNSIQRKNAQDKANSYITSYGDSKEPACDI